MLVTIVTFATPASGDSPRGVIEASAPGYQSVAGLRRKYFIGNAEIAGGVYEWQDRASAEQFFDEAWRTRMLTNYGSIPQVQYFDAPCLVDNVAKEIILTD